MDVLEHEHPLHIVDLQPNFPHFEEECDDEDEHDNDVITHQDFVNRQCDRCKQEIYWYHRYYYKCTHSCDYSLHKSCGELPITLKHTLHNSHTLQLLLRRFSHWSCVSCPRRYNGGLGYECPSCDFSMHANCAMESVEDPMIYHPSHRHPLVAIPQPLLSNCNACGEKHDGVFYICTSCFGIFIHSDCLFLPKTLKIQETTKGTFSHTHPLILSYSFPEADQDAKFNPRCRVCNEFFDEALWIFKCENCRYYTHLVCAASREEPFMSIFSYFGNRKLIKDFEESDYPDLLQLPFLDQSCNILKHLFFKDNGYKTFQRVNTGKLKEKFHQHPLILVHTQCNDIATPSSSRNNFSSCHNPMKKIELLCNGCLRPITSVPFYKCANEDQNCNFVLHEWCTRLPTEVKNYPDHPEHTLIFNPNVPSEFFTVFDCAVCKFPCNGFAYSCVQCDYHIDVNCRFIPEKITHEAHSGHLLSRVHKKEQRGQCRLCVMRRSEEPFSFICHTCNVYIHATCALLLPREIRHKYDKHPMSLSYFPVENHKSEYFCEICEVQFDPECCFYHCHRCGYSIHSACAPVILESERAIHPENYRGIYQFVNIKFGGVHNIMDHSHPLSFAQGIESDGQCIRCGDTLKYKMIFKCQQCKYAIDLKCCKRLSK